MTGTGTAVAHAPFFYQFVARHAWFWQDGHGPAAAAEPEPEPEPELASASGAPLSGGRKDTMAHVEARCREEGAVSTIPRLLLDAAQPHALRTPLRRTLPGPKRSCCTLQDEREYPVPRGLVNSGNSCFMNVVLQCLLACHPYRKLMAMLGGAATTTSTLRRPGHRSAAFVLQSLLSSL